MERYYIVNVSRTQKWSNVSFDAPPKCDATTICEMRATILSGGCGNLYWGEATSRNWFTWELTLKNNRREQTALIKRMSCIIQGGCRLSFSLNMWIHQVIFSIFMNSDLFIQSKGSRTSKHQWDHSFDHIHFI